jgi:hypothetical protein
MTPPHSHNLMRRLNFIVSRVALLIVTTALALFASGCFAPFIPLALDGVQMAGKLISGTAEASAGVKHSEDENPQETEVMDQTKFDDSDFDSSSSQNPNNAARCNELVLVTPAIIEFRTNRTGTAQWRELGLGGSPDAPRWTVLAQATGAAAKDVAPGGWAPANNLDHMDFKPPLKTSPAPGYGSFLAYAPAVTLAPVERDELASLALDFGPVLGTFNYNNRVFKYSTLEKLPCFPVPQ